VIVDAHAHVFPDICGHVAAGPTRSLSYGRVRVGSKTVQFLPPLCEKTTHSAEMLIAHMDWGGVDKAVLLQGPFYGDHNAYVAETAERFPDRVIAAAFFDPWQEGARDVLAGLLERRAYRAVKLECSEATGLCGLHPGRRLDDPDAAWLWESLERHGLVLTLDLGPIGSSSYQTEAVRGIAATHPGLRIVIAHLGQPAPNLGADPEQRRAWENQIDLGLLPNVWFDMAALPAYFGEDGYPYRRSGRYVRTAIERIGAGKTLWGSDIPGLLTRATYAQLVEMAQAQLGFLSTEERVGVLGLNALRVYSD